MTDWAALDLELGAGLLRPGEVVTVAGREHWVQRVAVFREAHRVHGALALGLDSVLYAPPAGSGADGSRAGASELPALWVLGAAEALPLATPPGALELDGVLFSREARLPAEVELLEVVREGPVPGARVDAGQGGAVGKVGRLLAALGLARPPAQVDTGGAAVPLDEGAAGGPVAAPSPSSGAAAPEVGLVSGRAGTLARYRGPGAAVALWWGESEGARLWRGEEHRGTPERWGIVPSP